METVHASPLPGHGLTPCCKRTVFELPRTDRLTNDVTKVTCYSLKERPILFRPELVREILCGHKTQTRRLVKMKGIVPPEHGGTWHPCPYGAAGDVLWVRESFSRGTSSLTYKADYLDEPDLKDVQWSPSIHMPKTMCRLWLQVASVRIERLLSISTVDAVAEGLKDRDDFLEKWESIHGKGSAEKDPLVWVIRFRVAVSYQVAAPARVGTA